MTILIILTTFNTLILVSMVVVIGYCVYLDYKNKAVKYGYKQTKNTRCDKRNNNKN